MYIIGKRNMSKRRYRCVRHKIEARTCLSIACEAWEGQEDQQVVADPNPDLEGEEKDRGVKAYRIIDKDASWEENLKMYICVSFLSCF